MPHRQYIDWPVREGDMSLEDERHEMLHVPRGSYIALEEDDVKTRAIAHKRDSLQAR